MARLVLSTLSRSEQSRLRKRDRCRAFTASSESLELEASGHVFHYRFRGELRFGPPYYSLTAQGPCARKFNSLFEGGDYFLSAHPHNAHSDTYLFERATDDDRLRRELSVYDLCTGRKVGSVEDDFLSPYCWRPQSDELIFDPWPDRFWKKWAVRSRKSKGLTRLCEKGNVGYVTSDGRYLIFLETGLPYVGLYDLVEDRVIHQLSKKDFEQHTPKPQTLHVVGFDPDRGVLGIQVNWSCHWEERPRVRCDFAARVALLET